jgi:hypothetical protein
MPKPWDCAVGVAFESVTPLVAELLGAGSYVVEPAWVTTAWLVVFVAADVEILTVKSTDDAVPDASPLLVNVTVWEEALHAEHDQPVPEKEL